MKIVILANSERRNQIFKQKHIDYLRQTGELVLNSSPEGPDHIKAAGLMEKADIAITSWNCPSLTEEILDKAPNLKLVVHGAGSVKGIVSEAMWNRKIRLSSAAAALGKGVAETALGLTITSLKNIWNLSKVTESGGWNRQNDTVREIYDVKIGVIGAGHAGSHYIKLLEKFDVEILLYDPTVSEEQCLSMGVKKSELENLMKKCDVISVHAPSIPATQHMINSEKLKLMKDKAILINTARGTIIDETALISELKKGRISACIDVTDPEPPSEFNELRNLPNVILTPHIAGSVNNGKKRIGDLVVKEISSFLEDGTLEYEVRKEKLGTLA